MWFLCPLKFTKSAKTDHGQHEESRAARETDCVRKTNSTIWYTRQPCKPQLLLSICRSWEACQQRQQTLEQSRFIGLEQQKAFKISKLLGNQMLPSSVQIDGLYNWKHILSMYVFKLIQLVALTYYIYLSLHMVKWRCGLAGPFSCPKPPVYRVVLLWSL